MDTSLTQRQGLIDGFLTTEEGAKQVLLSEPQRMALEWLMGGGSITEAAQYAGVYRQTVSEWVNHDEDFREIFERWQQQVKALNQARLIALSEGALDTVAGAIREHRDAKVALVVLKGMGMLGPAK